MTPDEPVPLDMAKRLLAKMVSETEHDDEPGQRLIRKYRRLIREEGNRQRQQDAS